MRLRPVRRPEDVTALEALFAVVTECDGHRPIGEHKYLNLLHGDPDDTAGLVLEAATHEVVAYAALSELPDGTCGLELAVHPLHRNHDALDRIIDGSIELCSARGSRRIRAWAFQPKMAAELEGAGFEPERELRQLRLPLPAPDSPRFPPGVTVREFRPGIDEEAWLEVNNAAFAGHPENGEWTLDVLADRRSQEWWDPAGFLMAWEGDELVGSCWTKMHGRGVGEIYVIGVSPAHQGRGLGRALVLAGLDYLATVKGCAEGMLYVDAANRPAISLYERMGFVLDHIDRSFVRSL